MTKIRETEYKNFGKCVELSNGLVKVLITVDVGPRIINYSFIDGENIMFEDVERCFSADVSGGHFDDDVWYIYGGHRLWTSPEGMPKSYYPDNEPVKYEEIKNGARFIPKPQKWNQYAFELEVTLAPDSSRVTINHKITNLAAWGAELAPWALTVLSPGGMEIVPWPLKDTGLLGNRLVALWPYTKMADERIFWGNKYVTLRQDKNNTDSFKFGVNSEHGFAMYFNHGDLFIKRFTPIENGNYPDGGMSFETFTNDKFLEMETLGEMSVIKPCESVYHSESWDLYKEAEPKKDENIFEKLVEKYVK